MFSPKNLPLKKPVWLLLIRASRTRFIRFFKNLGCYFTVAIKQGQRPPILAKVRFCIFLRMSIMIWSAICFKIMTRNTCLFFPWYLQSFLLHDIRAFFCHVYLRFIPKYMTIFLQTRIYMRTKKPIYMRYKQACGIWGHRKSSYKRHRIIPSAKNPFMYDGAEK